MVVSTSKRYVTLKRMGIIGSIWYKRKDRKVKEKRWYQFCKSERKEIISILHFVSMIANI